MKNNVNYKKIIPKNYIDNLLFLSIGGSYLYGTNNAKSDVDLRGFFLPSYQDLILNIPAKQFRLSDGEFDIVLYPLMDYINGLLKGDPLCLELLFCNQSDIFIKSEISDYLQNNRIDFISKNVVYNRILGFSRSEFRKAIGEKVIIEKTTPSEQKIIDDIKFHFNLEKEDIDTIINILNSKKNKRIIKQNSSSIGEKRRNDLLEYGYVLKSASNCIRLLSQSIELLNTGKISFPIKNRELVMQIKNGEIKKEKVMKIYDNFVNMLDDALYQSLLPDKIIKSEVMNCVVNNCFCFIEDSYLAKLKGISPFLR